MKSRVVTIRLPQEMKEDLESFSRAENIPISDLIRESLGFFLAVKRFRQLRRKTLPFAELQGILTDEDVFKAIS